MPTESLFTPPVQKRGRVCLMLVGSVLLHGGIVGFAAMWKTPEPLPPAADPGVEVVINPPTGGVETVNVIEPIATPVEVPPPEVPVDVTKMEQPTIEDPELALPEATPPLHRATVSRTVSVVRPANVPTGTRTAGPGQPGGIPGNNATGPGTSVKTNAWFMPHPSYPRNLLGSRATGTASVRVTTDASGRVSNVEVTRSTGNSALDFHTVSYIRDHWHGPPNASCPAEFIYQIK